MLQPGLVTRWRAEYSGGVALPHANLKPQTQSATNQRHVVSNIRCTELCTCDLVGHPACVARSGMDSARAKQSQKAAASWSLRT